MPVKKLPDGQRSVESEVEVPGDPEQVWQAIASGPGISSWFVPTELDGRVGGKAISHFGPGDSMDSVATITAWEPPYRFVAETLEEPGTVASEWTVEAKAGGTCKVRIVHRWFADSDDWDGQFEQHQTGWLSFFRLLRLYLTHFPGQASVVVPFQVGTRQPVAIAWAGLLDALGLAEPAPGRHVLSTDLDPALAGAIEFIGTPPYDEELALRVEQPGPGILHLFAMPMGDSVLLILRLFLYGNAAEATAQTVRPQWQVWLDRRYPSDDEETSE